MSIKNSYVLGQVIDLLLRWLIFTIRALFIPLLDDSAKVYKKWIRLKTLLKKYFDCVTILIVMFIVKSNTALQIYSVISQYEYSNTTSFFYAKSILIILKNTYTKKIIKREKCIYLV